MTANLKYDDRYLHVEAAPEACDVCSSYDASLCAILRDKVDPQSGRPSLYPQLTVSVHTCPPRRAICHPTEWSDFVSVICSGWAVASLSLADSRRQNLTFLLPGDMVSAISLFEATPGRLVESITDVTYRNYKRSELKSVLFAQPDVLEKVVKLWVEERKQADQLAADLGRRNADERISRLILNLAERLAKRGMMRNQSFEFPLRQHHIADATGLTPVHVSKVMSSFRRAGLIKIDNRSLTVSDMASLRRVAGIP